MSLGKRWIEATVRDTWDEAWAAAEHHDRAGASLPKNVHPEASDSRQTVGQISRPFFFKLGRDNIVLPN